LIFINLHCQHGSVAAPSSVKAAAQNLTDLKNLRISVSDRMVTGLMDFLQHVGCLKALQLLKSMDYNSSTFSPESMPGFSGLAALTNLILSGSEIDVELLSPCTQLQGLRLSHVSTVQDGGALLSCIARMTRLQVGPRARTVALPGYS
jgi:hypothetical protein